MLFTVYIADDEKLSRERLIMLINDFLENEIKILGEGGSASQVLSDVPLLKPDIVFLDIEMPGMSGLELAKQLKKTGFDGRIVFVTAYIQYSVKAIRAGAYDYLLKPVDVDELKDMFDRYLTERKNFFDLDKVQYFGLSERESEIIKWLSKGLSSEEIAHKMYISRHTVDTHRRNIHTKTGTKNTVELLNLLKK